MLLCTSCNILNALALGCSGKQFRAQTISGSFLGCLPPRRIPLRDSLRHVLFIPRISAPSPSLLQTVLPGMTSFMQCLQICQIIAAATLEADDMVDFPIFMQKLFAHRTAKLLPGGYLL